MIRHLLLLAAAGLPCRGDLLVHEPFDYSPGAVTGAGGGNGWSAAWTQDGESCQVSAGPLSYVDASGNQLAVSGSILDTSGPATTRSFRSIMDGPLNDVWISFLYQLTSANSLYEGVNFYRGSTSVFGVASASNTGGGEISFYDTTGHPTGLGAVGQTHFIVLHVTSGSNGAPDELSLYVDPSFAALGSPDAILTGADFSFDRIRIAGQSGASLLVDEIRIGDTFGDVSPHESNDADGDGLTNLQEVELGLNPNVSDLALIAAIRENADFFGLRKIEDLQAPSPNSVVLPVEEMSAALVFEIQESSDLDQWHSSRGFTREVPLASGQRFVRFGFPSSF